MNPVTTLMTSHTAEGPEYAVASGIDSCTVIGVMGFGMRYLFMDQFMVEECSAVQIPACCWWVEATPVV
jgi:hypothetical protein